MNSEKALYFFNILVSRLINAGKQARSLQPSKILCVKLDEIGDMATALGVFAELKKSFPSAEITVLCKPFAGSLLHNNPNVDRIIYELKQWNSAYDLVVELRGTWKTLWRALNYKYWPGYRVDRGWIRLKQRGNQPHEAITNYRIIEPVLKAALSSEISLISSNFSGGNVQFPGSTGLGLIHPTSEDAAAAELWMSQAQRQAFAVKGELPKGTAIIHAGARRVLRQWPLGNFATVADWLWEHHRIWPIWVGTAEEKPNLESVWKSDLGTLWISEEASPRNTSLLAFYAFIQRASLFIGNESGPLQLAALGDVPLLGLFGPGVEHVFYPIGAQVFSVSETGAISTEEQREVIEKETTVPGVPKAILHCVLPCNPCDQLHCIQPGNPCIQRISLTAVIQVLDKYVLTQ